MSLETKGDYFDVSILDNDLNGRISLQDFFIGLGYGINEKVYMRFFPEPRDPNVRAGKYEKEVGYFNDSFVNYLDKVNKEHHCIAFTPNGGGHNDEAVLKSGHCKVQFMEIDDVSFDEQIKRLNAFSLEPSAIIKTAKSLHCYWIVENGDIDRFNSIQWQFVKYFGSDPEIAKISQPMRLYGFLHQKHEPIMVKLIKFDPNLKYTQDQISEALPTITKADIEALKKRAKGKADQPKSTGPTTRAITSGDYANAPTGARTQTLVRYAGSLVYKGLTADEIKILIMAMNASYPEPLSENELKTEVFPSIKRFTDRMDGFKRNKNGQIVQCTSNAVEAIRSDPELQGKIRYNILSYSPFINGPLPWEHERTFREWNNTDDAFLKCYIEDKYELRQSEKLMDALTIVAQSNAYNPVREILEQCYREWDHKPHIVDLLPDYMGCERSQYNYEVMKLFMLGAISRAFNPGCKFDSMLVIYGRQGVGKSTFLRRLALNPEWFNDNFNTIEGDKAPEKLRGMWIVELAELLAMKSAKEIESIKAFLTSQYDTYRPPYGRRTEMRPRTCVFAGTTNNERFLVDKTGNRRFHVIESRKDYITKSVHEDSCILDFKQAWGEAMDIYKQAKGNVSLVLSDEVATTALEMQANYTIEDPRIGVIQNWLDSYAEALKNKTEKLDRVCVTMIYQQAFNRPGEFPTRKESNEILEIMTNSVTRWHKFKNKSGGRARCSNYGTQICFTPDLAAYTNDFIDVN